jgi:hypothetical protein
VKSEDYPALYRCADEASLAAQQKHIRLFQLHSILLVAGAALSVYGIQDATSAAVAAIAFILAIGVPLFLELNQFVDAWYRTRAIAESVKTSTWLFMMRAEPFSTGLSSAEADKRLTNVLGRILSEHTHYAVEFASRLSGAQQITTSGEIDGG